MSTSSRFRLALLTALVAGQAVLLPWTVAAAESSATVEVSSFEYSPIRVEIVSGGSVTWTWTGDDRHSVTADGGAFDSDPDCSAALPINCRTSGDPEFTWRAPEVDRRTNFPYRCRLHGDQGMRGTIVVLPPEPSPEPSSTEPSPSESPTPAPSPTPTPTRSPSPSPSSRSTAASGPRNAPPPRFGPPTAGPTQPLPTILATETPSVLEEPSDPDLEEFPAPAPIPTTADADGEVVVATPGSDGPERRTVLIVVAAVALAGTTAAFASLVLFGPEWG